MRSFLYHFIAHFFIIIIFISFFCCFPLFKSKKLIIIYTYSLKLKLLYHFLSHFCQSPPPRPFPIKFCPIIYVIVFRRIPRQMKGAAALPNLPFAFPFRRLSLLFLFALCLTFFRFAFAIILPSGAHLQSLSPAESVQLGEQCGGRFPQSFPSRLGRAHPWAVSFMTKGRNRLGGTIISPWHILTAAHGFLRFDSTTSGKCDVFGYRNFETVRHGWTVVYGDDCIWQQPNDYLCARPNLTQNRIRAIFVDDGFADGVFGCFNGHDWAIVELEVPIAFSDRVQPICLPSSPAHQQISDGEVLTVTSWGRRDAFHKGDPLIREIPLRHDAECKSRPWTDTMPTNVEDYLCAKALNPKDYRSARTCHGDSGSGMEWKRTERRNIGTARQNTTRQPFQSQRPQIVPTAAALPTASSLLSSSDQLVGIGPKANGSVTQRIAMPMAEKRVPLRGKRRKSKVHSRNVLRSPLVIPQLEMMKKWRKSRRNDQPTGKEEAFPQSQEGDELVKLLLNKIEESAEEEEKQLEEISRTDRSETVMSSSGTEEWSEAVISRTELIGVTSYGSRQCGSDELARFTRIAHYVRKICSLTGVCYQLSGIN